MKKWVLLTALLILFISQTAGLVMNENTDTLPPGCEEVNGWQNITVRAGTQHAKEFNGKLFTYDDREYNFEPCQKVTVTFVNNDSVRHQWMVHGLPKSIYNMGMFSIEVTGPGQDTGTFILPSYRETLLVHCGVPQHEQKGMKAQIKINGGHGDLGNIPGITGAYKEYDYPQQETPLKPVIGFFLGLLLGGIIPAGYSLYRTST